DLFVEANDALRFFHFRIRNVDAKGLHLTGIGDAWIDVRECAEGTNHQAGANEQHQGERHLNDDEDTADAVLFSALAESAAAFTDAGAKADAGVFENGNGSEEKAGEQ